MLPAAFSTFPAISLAAPAIRSVSMSSPPKGVRGLTGGSADSSCGASWMRLRVRIDVAALEEIIEPADAVPAISIAFHHQPVAAAFVGAAVILAQKIDQQLAGFAGQPDRKRDLARLLIEIVHQQHRIVPPVITD